MWGALMRPLATIASRFRFALRCYHLFPLFPLFLPPLFPPCSIGGELQPRCGPGQRAGAVLARPGRRGHCEPQLQAGAGLRVAAHAPAGEEGENGSLHCAPTLLLFLQSLIQLAVPLSIAFHHRVYNYYHYYHYHQVVRVLRDIGGGSVPKDSDVLEWANATVAGLGKEGAIHIGSFRDPQISSG